jgi:hypothetical protein
MRPRISAIFVLATAGLATASANAADWIKFGEETFQVAGGGFYQTFNTKVEVEDQGFGSTIDLEDDLDYDDDDVSGMVNATWRFADRHRLSLGYFESNRDVSALATGDIDIGNGEIIPAGAGYESKFDIKTYPFKYAYSFSKTDKSEFSGSIGFHWMTIDYNIIGALGLDENELEGRIEAEADAPMPLLGLSYDYYLSDRWKLNLGTEAFYIKLSDDTFQFEGGLVNASVGTEYYIWNNLSVGAAVSYFYLNADLDDSDWRGSLEYSYWGPSAFITARF